MKTKLQSISVFFLGLLLFFASAQAGATTLDLLRQFEYQPDTVNIDGWQSTQNARNAVSQDNRDILLLHIFIGIRDRSRKKYTEHFLDAATRLWIA